MFTSKIFYKPLTFSYIFPNVNNNPIFKDRTISLGTDNLFIFNSSINTQIYIHLVKCFRFFQVSGEQKKNQRLSFYYLYTIFILH